MSASEENRRIAALPRRRWQDFADVSGVTRRLRTKAGTIELRQLQAAVLDEAPKLPGVLVVARVGSGKTMIAACLPTVRESSRPVIFTGGANVKDMLRDLRNIGRHLKVSPQIVVKSYNWLAQKNNKGWLERYKPDHIVLDEAHKSSNTSEEDGASCAKRIFRYYQEYGRRCYFDALTATATPDGSIAAFAPLLEMTLRSRSPIPRDASTIRAWEAAMNGTGNAARLLKARDELDAQRKFRERFHSAPGVFVFDAPFEGPLEITSDVGDPTTELETHFATLRRDWEMPDGWQLGDDKFQVAAAARRLVHGFWYGHDPRPSEEFLKRRKAWVSVCKHVIKSGACDSEGEVKTLVTAGDFGENAFRVLGAYNKIRRAEPMQRVTRWESTKELRELLYLIKHNPKNSIFWVSSVELGVQLEHYSGLHFFGGNNGRDPYQKEDGSRSIIASIKALGTGKNLQGPFEKGLRAGPFFRNFVLDIPVGADAQEQMIGRTHRDLQEHPVLVHYRLRCREHLNAIEKCLRNTDKIENSLYAQKLTAFDFVLDHESDHAAWKTSADFERDD